MKTETEKFTEKEKKTNNIMMFNQTTEDIPLMMGDVPEQNSKEMFRPAMKWIVDEYDNIHESIRMAELMDGSGECGKFIWAGYADKLKRMKEYCEMRFNIDWDILQMWVYGSARMQDKHIPEHITSYEQHVWSIITETKHEIEYNG